MKSVKILIKSADIEWKLFFKIMRDYQYDTARALNHCMTNWFLFESAKKAWKERTGLYPTKDEMPDPNNYQSIRRLFPNIPSGQASSIAQKSKQRWGTDKKEVAYKLTKSLPSFKKNHPILIRAQDYKICVDDGNYCFSFPLLPKNVPDGPKRVNLVLSSKLYAGEKNIVDNIVSGVWKSGAVQISYNENKRKWFVNIAYEPEKKTYQLSNNIVGVDLGVSTAISCASSNGDRFYINGGEISRFRKTVRNRRIQRQRQVSISGRTGHGRRRALSPVSTLQDKEKNFSDTTNHRYSKAIVDFAIKNNASTIQLEDLSGLVNSKQNAEKGDSSYFMKGWTIYNLQEKIEYKAAEVGIDVVYVNPQYTSQRCSKCGHIDRGNRKEQARFECLACGFKGHADWNAAMNLCIKGIEDIISDKLKTRIVKTDYIVSGDQCVEYMHGADGQSLLYN